MRKHFVALVAGLIAAGTAVAPPAGAGGNAQWITTLPLSTEAINAFPDGSVFLVTNGVLWRSIDRGLTWTPRPLPAGLDRVEMATPQVGFAVDQVHRSTPPTVHRTLDGGVTWLPITVPWQQHTSYYVSEIVTSDDGRTVVLGTRHETVGPTCVPGITEPQLYVSNDAGETWSYRSLKAPGIGVMRRGDFSDANTGVITVHHGEWSATECFETKTTFTMWLTRNGGRTFTQIFDCPTWCHDVAVLPSGRIVAQVLGYDQIQLSDDFGKTWRAVQLPERQNGVKDLDFADSRVGYTVGSGPNLDNVYRTEDGGETWTAEPVQVNGIRAISAIDATGAVLSWQVNLSFHGGVLTRTG